MDMTTQGKLEACDGFRSEGNAFYREGQYHRAGDRYRKVISKGRSHPSYTAAQTNTARPCLNVPTHRGFLFVRTSLLHMFCVICITFSHALWSSDHTHAPTTSPTNYYVLWFLPAQALVYFEYVFADTDEEQVAVDQLKLLCLLNHAASKIKTEEYGEAHNSCSEVRRGLLVVVVVARSDLTHPRTHCPCLL